MRGAKSGLIKTNVDLSGRNTFGVSANAQFFATIKDAKQLMQLVNDEIYCENANKYVLGGGSNSLFVNDFYGLMLHNCIKGIEVLKANDSEVVLNIGGGENWHDLVLFCLKNGWQGLENLSLIPGTVGAAPVQNIGAYGVELDSCFVDLQAVDLATGKPRTFTKTDCAFAYRNSIFKNELKGQFLISSVTLRLNQKQDLNVSYGAIKNKLLDKGITEPTAKNVSDVVIEIRQSKLPNPDEIGNAGSFFKNPIVSQSEFENLKNNFSDIKFYSLEDGQIKIPAAWLIEQCGLKGYEQNGAGIYKNHALILINSGTKKGSDIWALAQHVKHSVKQKFGIDLQAEVNIIG